MRCPRRLSPSPIFRRFCKTQAGNSSTLEPVCPADSSPFVGSWQNRDSAPAQNTFDAEGEILEHDALTKMFPSSERCHQKSLLGGSATVSRCDLERRLQGRLSASSPGNVESSELVLPLTWFVCTDRTWLNSLWHANVSRSKNSRRIMIATNIAPTQFALQVRVHGPFGSRSFGRRYIPGSSPPAVNMTCFSCAICACAW
jgi:hypothetical protein